MRFSEKEQQMETAWQDLFSKFASGEDWQQSFYHYTQELRDQVEEFLTGILKNDPNRVDLWQIYVEEMQKFNPLWINGLSVSLGSLSQAAVTHSSKPWIELNDLYWNLVYEKTLGSLTRMPLLGPSRGFNNKLTRVFDAWAKLYPTSIDYQIVLAEIQMQSFSELMQELILLAAKGETVKDWQQFLSLWGHTADKVFEKAFCSADNLKIRGRFLNAINHHKLCQQEVMEVWMTMMNMPIRSEVDEVHKSVYELRKEVKSLKKVLAKYEAQAQEIPPDLAEVSTYKER